ncbi:MAG: hypothetical protein ACLFM7_02900 [Bacteroidales bacterium]
MIEELKKTLDILRKRAERNLELTISGEIPFNEDHPFYHDEKFFNDLLNYYQKREDYETCNSLLNKWKKKSRGQ